MKYSNTIKQKEKELDFFFSWLVHRRIAKPIVFLLLRSRVTPNQVSVVSILVGLVGIYLLAIGNNTTDLSGILILHLAQILDCVDGDLVRSRNMESTLLGKFTDYIKTIIIDPLIPIAFTFGSVNQGYSIWWLMAMIVVSFWRIGPQYAREHVVVRSLEDKEKIHDLDAALFIDPQKKMASKNNRFSILNFGIKMVKGIIGLPNAMLNTILLITLFGFATQFEIYNNIKLILTIIIIFSYAIFFVLSLKNEVKTLS